MNGPTPHGQERMREGNKAIRVRSRSVLIVGGKHKIVRKAKRLGLDVIYFQKKDLYTDEHASFVDHVMLFDYENDRIAVPLAHSLHDQIRFQSVLSLTEPGLLPAARINDALGLGGTSSLTARRLMDKWEMRKLLNAHGLSRVEAASGTTRAELEAFLATHPLPAILKPVDGTASRGVAKIGSRTEIDRAWSTIPEPGRARFIVEEYLDGPEFSVESFSFVGRHVVLAITEKLCSANFVEIGHVLPAELPEKVEEQVITCVENFLDLVGLENGPAHTEVKLTQRGPRIVESHNRIGGDKINELVDLALGIDMDTLALAWPFGLAASLAGRPRPRPRQTAAIRFFTPTPGIVESVSGLEEAKAVEGMVELELNARTGSHIPPLSSSMDRVGHVITVGSSAREAVARCEQARNLVRFTMSADHEEVVAP